jgi:hypothetical protein
LTSARRTGIISDFIVPTALPHPSFTFAPRTRARWMGVDLVGMSLVRRFWSSKRHLGSG